MDDFTQGYAPDRLSHLSVPARSAAISTRHTVIIRSLRFILPLVALALTVIVVTWDEGGRVEPVKKDELIPQAESIQNELMKPVFNSVDEKGQPYSITADRAVQGTQNPDIVTLINPVAKLDMDGGSALGGRAKAGLYEQKAQKLNLEGGVALNHSNGYTLTTEELRIDIAAQKAWSGRDVHVAGPDGTIDATGLEADTGTGAIIFTGPARVILKSDVKLYPAKEQTP